MNIHTISSSLFKAIALPTLFALTISCSSSYTVSTNVDKKNFTHYFSPTNVNIYKDEKDFPAKYKLIGLVEGQDCQLKAHHAAPDEITARTNARRNAKEKEANAIIFTGCAPIESDVVMGQCLSMLVCYGKAYQIETPKHD